MHGWCRPWSCPVAPDPSTWRPARGPTARRRDRAKCSRPATVLAPDQYADQATPIAAPRHRTSRMPDNVRLASRPGTRFDPAATDEASWSAKWQRRRWTARKDENGREAGRVRVGTEEYIEEGAVTLKKKTVM